MCNGRNHSLYCPCAFGPRSRRAVPVSSGPPIATWYAQEDFTRPTTCPRCGSTSVWFVRHNGGSVWFDSLGQPWPKHGCFDDGRPVSRLREQVSRLTAHGRRPGVGIILQTVATHPGYCGRIAIRCFDGAMLDRVFFTPTDLTKLVGQLVTINRTPNGCIMLAAAYTGEPPTDPAAAARLRCFGAIANPDPPVGNGR